MPPPAPVTMAFFPVKSNLIMGAAMIVCPLSISRRVPKMHLPTSPQQANRQLCSDQEKSFHIRNFVSWHGPQIVAGLSTTKFWLGKRHERSSRGHRELHSRLAS